jgi:uncharacterized protein YecE (DUF72 family)
MPQIGMFGPAPPLVGPAAVPEATRTLAASLPKTLRMGPSTWTYSGWSDLVYDRPYSDALLAKHGLGALAQHPLMRTAGVDRTFYRSHTTAEWRALAATVPDGFRVLVKAAQETVLAVFPNFPRYGARAGQRNAHFLDAAWTQDTVVGPWADGLRDRCGPLLFQVPPQHPADLGGPEAFAERLHRFFSALPPPPPTGRYVLEVRDPTLQTPALAQALRETRVLPALVLHPRMPDLRTQWRRAGIDAESPIVLRWMMRRGIDHETARVRFSPFDALCAEDPDTRDTVARLCRAMAEAGRSTWVVVSNNAEGCAPRSIIALAQAIVGGANPLKTRVPSD